MQPALSGAKRRGIPRLTLVQKDAGTFTHDHEQPALSAAKRRGITPGPFGPRHREALKKRQSTGIEPSLYQSLALGLGVRLVPLGSVRVTNGIKCKCNCSRSESTSKRRDSYSRFG